MANKLIIRNQLEPQIETAETIINSGTYTHFEIEKAVGSNGGSYETTFTDSKAIKYVGVVSGTTEGGVAVGSAFEGGVTTTGAAPGATGVKAFYVKYDSVLGTVNNIKVFVGSQQMATLTEGESVCIPLVTGALAGCKIEADDYLDGTTEASATVVLIGD
jgi:hypothetical protein